MQCALERYAIVGRITMEKLAEIIERLWPLSDVGIGDLQDSQGAAVYRLRTNQGAFMLKVLASSIDAKRANRYIHVLDFLNKCNFPAPRVLATRDGRFLSNWKGRYIYILLYIEGRTVEESEKEEYELGRVASRLHAITDYPYQTSLVTKTILLSRLNGSHIKTEYDKLILSLPDFSKDSQVLIHTDLCPSNAIWTQDGTVMLIDFDDAGMGAKSLDIGYPLFTQFIDYEGRLPRQAPKQGSKLYFKENVARAFYAGYFANTTLNSDEKELIFDGALFRMLEELAYLPSEALDFRWKHIQYALDNKENILRAM